MTEPDETDVEWPEPQPEPSEPYGETLANDGTPGAAPGHDEVD
jgi:hypothetical protein